MNGRMQIEVANFGTGQLLEKQGEGEKKNETELNSPAIGANRI